MKTINFLSSCIVLSILVVSCSKKENQLQNNQKQSNGVRLTSSPEHNMPIDPPSPKPKAGFNYAYNKDNFLNVSFTTASTGADEWEWNFGDGQTSTDINPQHTYAAFGNYEVTLTITTILGASLSASKIIIIAPDQPFADFSILGLYNNPYRPDDPYNRTVTVIFKNLSKNYRGCLWNFCDGKTIIGDRSYENQLHTFPNFYTNYLVKLTVTDSMGKRPSTIYKVVVPKDLPDYYF